MLTCSEYLTPETLRQGLEALSSIEGDKRLLSGATDTLPWARQGRAGDISGDHHVETIIDISRIGELAGYEIKSGRVRIGANLVFQTFLEDQELKAHLPHMPYCAIWFADDQIRRQATLVGNLANASPAADGTPPMVALDAEVELARLDGDAIGRRSVPLNDFIIGPGRTAIKSDEIITAIICDALSGYGGSFEKVGQRRSLVISVVCTTCCVKTSDDGSRFEDVRIALGGVGPVPMRLADVEEILRGKEITQEIISEAVDMTPARVASRSRREYRAEVVRGLTERAIKSALADCPSVSQSLFEEVANG